MPNYVVTQKAQDNIDEILIGVVEYTGFEESALKLEDELHRKFALIAEFPHIGTDRKDGTFETFTRNYRIVYEIIENDVFITTVIHTRRLYPRV